jgi:large subunit ribosomal protein L10
MSKLVKDMIANELRSRYGELDSALWLEIVGVDGITTNEFRRELRGKNMRLEVVKNLLFKRAIGDGPLKPLAAALAGPAAILTGGESLVDCAKLVNGWLSKVEGIRLRGAVLEGEWLDQARAASLAKMPNKRELQGRVATIVITPAANVVGALSAGGANIAACLKAMIDKLEKGEELVKRSA